MYIDEVLCRGRMERQHEKYPGCILRKAISKDVTAGGRFDFFLDSAVHLLFLHSSFMEFYDFLTLCYLCLPTKSARHLYDNSLR